MPEDYGDRIPDRRELDLYSLPPFTMTAKSAIGHALTDWSED